MILFTYLKIFFHVLYGFFVVVVQFRFANQMQRNQLLKEWSRKLLKILGVELNIIGIDKLSSEGVLYVSNHISWLDIHVINAWRPMRFVAKKEVGEWPVFGWFAKQLNTLFIDRQLKGDSKNVSRQMVQALKQGDQICIFPEGTSTDGHEVLPFKPNLFQAALDAQTECQPISITYVNHVDGRINLGPSFIGDMGLLESIANTVKASPMKVCIAITEICQSKEDRKSLSDEAWKKINDSRSIKN